MTNAKGNKGQPPKKRNLRKPAPVAPIPTSSELLNYAQAAQFLGVAQGTLENWVSNGIYSVPYIKLGRLIRFSKFSLSRWIESRERNQLVAMTANEAALEL